MEREIKKRYQMINDKGILIRNIYYMLTYAFTDLKHKYYENIAKEEFKHIYDIFAEILYKGMSMQIKQGLYRAYIDKHENLYTLRGKLDLQGTINDRIRRQTAIYCEYDELSVDNILNQILKFTAMALIREGSVGLKRRAALRRLMLYFSSVSDISRSDIHWSTLRYGRNNQSYRMLMNICYFILDGMLMTTEAGEYKMAAFSEEHMHKLFERFVLEYYRIEHKELNVCSSEIKWDIDYDAECCIEFLPKMQSDIILKKGERTFIIDTKYYGKTLSTHYDKKTLHSANMYQIFTYVKNYDKEQSGNVAGILLYAKTSEDITADFAATFGKNKFWVKTLDLNQEFEEIKNQLNAIQALYLS